MIKRLFKIYKYKFLINKFTYNVINQINKIKLF